MKRTFSLVVLIVAALVLTLTTSGQETPVPRLASATNDRCVNAQTWFRSFAKERKQLSVSILRDRMQAMSNCDGQDISKEDQWYVLQAESAYMSELLVRHAHYLQRHNQNDQFLNEDKAGER